MASRLQMVQMITTELGVYDQTSLDLCAVFLSRQYVNIWDKYPWKDAMGYVVMQAIAGASNVAYPPGMDRVITVRASQSGAGASAPDAPPGFPDFPDEAPDEPEDPTVPVTDLSDSRFLDPVDSSFLIESEPSIYEARGYTKYYEETHWSGGRQIRLYPIPITGTTLLFYGKLVCPGLQSDGAVSLLRNIDPVLMAYAYFDMLQRQRQYGKAEVKRKEAQELEAVAWSVEQQQANKPRRTKAVSVAGNTLVEMTEAVCTICGQWTPEYRHIIIEFLRRNYQTLYDTYLWPESIVGVRVPYTTANVIMPEYIDKVLAVRGNNNLRLSPVDAVLIMDLTPEMFSEFGDPIQYIITTPVGVATLPSTTTRLSIASTSPLDVSEMAIRGEIYSVGVQAEEKIRLNGLNPVLTVNSYDVPVTVAKDLTYGQVTVTAAVDNRLLLKLLPYQRESKHQRLNFYPLPDTSKLAEGETFHCVVLGKRSIRPLLIDQDTPIITGAQQVLIAAAAGDLFRRMEKHDMANAFLQKASASTDVLKAKNTDQAAFAPRFVPQVEAHAYVAGCTW